MDKKLIQMNQAFEHLRFTDCLAIIDQLIKKYSKPDKKKQMLSIRQMKIVKCFKTGALASLGRQHQANAIFDEICQPESIVMLGQDYTYLILSIAELFGENRQKIMLQLLDKHTPGHKKQTVYRFYLGSKMFAPLSKIFMKEFITNKNIMMQFNQIYLDYLQCLDKIGLFQYKRDGWYKCHPELKVALKMVSMFLDKCVKGAHQGLIKNEKQFKEGTILKQPTVQKLIMAYKKVISISDEVKLKIAINQGRVQDAIISFEALRNQLKFPFTFLRSILKLRETCEEKQQIEQFYVNQMSRIFRINLNFEHYTPWYDYYNQFLWQVIERAQKIDPAFKSKISLKQTLLPSEVQYIFQSTNPTEILLTYFNSLFSEYDCLTNQDSLAPQKQKKSDYYKICIKGLLLQLIQISSYIGHQEYQLKYLKKFSLFGNTLTYAHQMKKYWKILISQKIIVRPESVKNDNQLIEEINFHKIRLGVESLQISQQSVMAVYKQLSELYRIRVKQIQNNRHLEKGQRYISDQFYTLIADYTRKYIQTQQTPQTILKVISLLITDLQTIIEVSPYNADTKLRLMYFCSLLNHHERMIDIFFSNDIKSVQWETLGYWFVRPGIQFGVGENSDQFMDKFVKSYQQNQRQTSEYGIKALKAGQLDRVDEYINYRTCILNSYNSVILNYCLFQRYRFQPHSEYYLIKINQKINSFQRGQTQLTFNADFKVMKNQIFGDIVFGDCYGIFNSWELLQMETHLCMYQQSTAFNILDRDTELLSKNLIQLPTLQQSITSFQVSRIFNFKRFTFQEEEPNFNCQQSKYTLNRTGSYLSYFVLVSQVRIGVVMLANQLNQFVRQKEVNKQIFGQLKDKVMKSVKTLAVCFTEGDYYFQLHAISMIRRGLFQSYNLLNLVRETVQKNKKLKFAKETVSATTDNCLEFILETILNLKWSKPPTYDFKLLQTRDEVLERQLTMDMNQAKRIISKFQSSYKL